MELQLDSISLLSDVTGSNEEETQLTLKSYLTDREDSAMDSRMGPMEPP